MNKNLNSPQLNDPGIENEMEITHFLETYFEVYIYYITEYEKGFFDISTFRRWLEYSNLKSPSEDVVFVYECFEYYAEMEFSEYGGVGEWNEEQAHKEEEDL